MTPELLRAYVTGALALHGYRLDDAQTARVVAQFAQIEAIAQAFLNLPLPFDSEPAPVFGVPDR